MQTLLLDHAGVPARIGTVRLHLGDWRRAWWLWPEDCALITDPPYGIAYKAGHHEGFSGVRDGVERTLATHVAGDETTQERDEALDQPWTVAAVWGPRDLVKTPPWATIPPRTVLIHDKGEGVGMGDLSFPWKPNYETIAIYGQGWSGKRTTSVLQGRVVAFGASSASNGRKHPNQKPLTVCAELVSKSPAGLEVVDPFAGSGQILLAAALLGRDVCGAELDPAHFKSCCALLAANGVRVLTAPQSK